MLNEYESFLHEMFTPNATTGYHELSVTTPQRAWLTSSCNLSKRRCDCLPRDVLHTVGLSRFQCSIRLWLTDEAEWELTMTRFGGGKEGKYDKLDQRRVQFSRRANLHQRIQGRSRSTVINKRKEHIPKYTASFLLTHVLRVPLAQCFCLGTPSDWVKVSL